MKGLWLPLNKSALGEFTRALFLALGICGFRIALFDRQFFTFAAIPNHDTLGAAGPFESSMHAMRLEGDIAWWLPSLTDGGYAQYFNHLFAPLAPTAGHPPFLLWGELVRLLSFAGIAVPEYFQFLVYEYVLAPVLAYLGLALLCRRYCMTWRAVALAVCAYALGGPGIWNGAWMFYQEWFCIFLLLFGWDLFVRRTSVQSLAILSFATINVVASLNYWTVFSSWFVAALLVAHACFYWPLYRDALSWIRGQFSRPHSITIIAFGIVVSTCAIWLLIAGLAYSEQSELQIRNNGGNFPTVTEARDWAIQGGTTFVASFFRAEIPASTGWPHPYVSAHHARYIGISLLPLLILFFAMRWSQFERLAFFALVCVAMVFTCSGIFLVAYEFSPGMSHIRWVFYFYIYFAEILLIMMAARAYDFMNSANADLHTTRILMFVVISLSAMGLLLPGLLGPGPVLGTSQDESVRNLNLTSLIGGLGAILLLQLTTGDPRTRKIFSILFLVFTIGDLGRYYWEASRRDQSMTLWFRQLTLQQGLLPKELSAQLSKTWQVVMRATSSDPDNFQNIPIVTYFWPVNRFNPSVSSEGFRREPEERRQAMTPSALFDLALPGETTPGTQVVLPMRNPAAFSFRIVRPGYNQFSAEVNSDREGLVLANINFDRGWRVYVDDQRVGVEKVNIRMIAFPVTSGTHRIMFSYWPTSRMIYVVARPVTLLAMFSLLLIIFTSAREDEARRPRDQLPHAVA